MYASIWNELETILNSLVAGTKLNTVFNYDIKQYQSFPCASISPLDDTEIFFDTADNQIDIQFRIRVADQNRNISVMEDRMRTLCDQVTAELRKSSNQTLNDSVCAFQFNVIWWWIDDQQPIRIFDINLTAKVITAIN